jgi:CRP/FNR family transcriptional regulator
MRTLNVCAPLDDDELARLVALGKRLYFRKGDTLFHPEQRQGPFFKLTDGFVAVSRRLKDGRRQVVGLRLPGDVVGYLNTDGMYTFEGEALTDVAVCSFDRDGFDHFAAAKPKLAAAVSLALSEALKQTGQEMTSMGQLRSVERVASFLALLHESCQQRRLPTTPLPLPMSRRDIADYLGLVVETVSRAFSELRRRKVIAVAEAGVEILDYQALAVIAKRDV